ncbi:biotin carboxylase [Catenulispora sp. MAP12-49]|uniref:ATP-grasp domain-containing protein n=1 Tax=unclassified Catenulispora TaxID=414885 RepID=UPI003518F006
MMRKLLFVESNTTGSGMRALVTAAELGFEPVLLTSRPSRYRGLDQTGATVADCQTNDFDALLAASRALGTGSAIAGATTTSEFYLFQAARLAEALGLPGNPPEAVSVCRDKGRTRRLLAAAGVGQPDFELVQALGQLPAALERIGLPAVVKPVDESGSLNVRLCHDEAEATELTMRVLAVQTNTRDQPAAGRVLVEEYVQAPEYSVEMFSVNGVAHALGVTEKTMAPPPFFVEAGHVFPAPLATDVRRLLLAEVAAALSATGIRNGPTHTEVRLHPERGPVVIEINARMAGGMIPELMRLATGADVLRAQIVAASGAKPALPDRASAVAGIRFLLTESEGVLDAVSGVRDAAALEGISEVTVTAQKGTRVRRPQSSYDRLGYVIGTGATPEEVRQRLAAAVTAIGFDIVV